jgi:hypothetical protein
VAEIVAKHSDSREDLTLAYAGHVNNFENYTKTLTNPKEIAAAQKILNQLLTNLSALRENLASNTTQAAPLTGDIVDVVAPTYPLYPNKQSPNYPTLLLKFKEEVRAYRHNMFNFMLTDNFNNMTQLEKDNILVQMDIATRDLNENVIRSDDVSFLDGKTKLELKQILIKLGSTKHVGKTLPAKPIMIEAVLSLLMERQYASNPSDQPVLS